MKLILDGLKETEDYKAWKFPGGEVHVKLSDSFLERADEAKKALHICSRITCSDDLIMLMLVVDAINADYIFKKGIYVFLPYMPYAQADRKFSVGESFSLPVIAKMLTGMGVTGVSVFDPHSDVTPALLGHGGVMSNNEFIKYVLSQLPKDTMLLSPDAGAYKKIFKLASEIGFTGPIQCCNKYRDKDGHVEVQVPALQYHPGPILIVDDICLGGATFLNIAHKLREGEYLGKLYLAVSHGIFSNGTEILHAQFDKIFTTNSRYTGEDEGVDGNFRVI